ncbi:AAA family ATPase [Vreelandella sp. V005]|uniref:AAA family ATPase n=1 Tax=Vreelandella sp. V005 TaxID=3459608 RepID=UPI004043D46E
MHCLFEGHKALFESLYIQDKWDRGTTYPVARFSFSNGVLQSRAELVECIREQLLLTERERLGLSVDHKTDIAGEFETLLRQAHFKANQHVVVLTDEYGKLILVNFTQPRACPRTPRGLNNLNDITLTSPFPLFVTNPASVRYVLTAQA